MNAVQRIIIILLSCLLLLSGCSTKDQISESTSTTHQQTTNVTGNSDSIEPSEQDVLDSVEDSVFSSIIDQIDGKKYYIENITSTFVSQEYLEELQFNSTNNSYFGYNLNDLERQFEGTRYVFYPSEDGSTKFKEFKKNEDYDKVLERSVASVKSSSKPIMTFVTLSAISAAVGQEAISMVLFHYATTTLAFAVAGATIGAIAGAITEGIESNGMDMVLKRATEYGAIGFKWGAIVGTIAGPAKTAKLYKAMKISPPKNLTIKDAVAIQQVSHYPSEIINNMYSIKEYKIYKKLKLKPKKINGRWVLSRKIDLNYVSSQMENGKLVRLSNLERINRGLSPIDPKTNKVFELHHIGQEVDSPLAILSKAEHQKYYKILHQSGKKGVHSQLPTNVWQQQVSGIWSKYKELYGGT